MDSSLYPYERHVACFLAALFIFLGVLSYLEKKEIDLIGKEIVSVKVVGAVEPKTIPAPRGATVDEVLSQVVCLADADFQEVDGARQLLKDEIVVVPYRDRLTLYMRGAVQEERVLVVERGARAREILSQVVPTKEADVQRFLRRRKFINGTVIDIFPRKDSSH